MPEGWAWARLKSISQIGTGATPLKANSAYYEGGNIAWITSSSTSVPFISDPTSFITELALAETNCTVYEPGTLIVAMYGEGKTRGQISELTISAATNQACAAISLINNIPILRSYIKAFFIQTYEELRSKAQGGQQPNLNQTIIAEMLVPIPPALELSNIMRVLNQALDTVSAIQDEKEDIIRTAVPCAAAKLYAFCSLCS